MNQYLTYGKDIDINIKLYIDKSYITLGKQV